LADLKLASQFETGNSTPAPISLGRDGIGPAGIARRCCEPAQVA
jgi:hypothetical protein